MKLLLRTMVIVAGIALTATVAAAGETTELRVAKQYGLGYLQMMVMEDKQLVEKHAKTAGLAGCGRAVALAACVLGTIGRPP